ncbi:MAG: DUF5685 family protein [Anaerolineae bacterium]|nr:DUF5685 family protein [Anaerolineae bacterium]
MLKKQHQFSAQLTGEARQHYRLHMCSLCHTLGDHYGHMARLLTSGEMILLNLLTSAQTPTPSEIVMRRCPLNPTRHVRTQSDTASEFAAQVAVSLADVKIADDLSDAPGPRAHLAHWLLSRPADAARQALQELGFDTATFAELTATQAAAEQDDSADPAHPSALISAQLFAHTAHLAGIPENAEALAVIGANYGAYIYLMDAYTDYPQDMVKGTFNPLRRYTTTTNGGFELTPSGQTWLLSRFEAIRAAIVEQLPRLQLYRANATLTTLLTEPLDKVIQTLHQQLEQHQTWQYRQWKKTDILKAALFILPTAVAAKGLTFVNVGEDFGEAVRLDGRRRRQRGNCTDDCDLYFCSSGSHYGAYNSDAACVGELCSSGGEFLKCGSLNLDACDGDALSGCGDNMSCDGMDSCDGFDCNT